MITSLPSDGSTPSPPPANAEEQWHAGPVALKHLEQVCRPGALTLLYPDLHVFWGQRPMKY